MCLPFGGTGIKHPRTLKQLRTTTHNVTHVPHILKTCCRVSRRSRENISCDTWKASCAPVLNKLPSSCVNGGEDQRRTTSLHQKTNVSQSQGEATSMSRTGGPQPMSSSMSEARVAVPFFCPCQKFSQPANKRVDLFVPGTISRCPRVYIGGGRSKEDEHTVRTR